MNRPTTPSSGGGRLPNGINGHSTPILFNGAPASRLFTGRSSQSPPYQALLNWSTEQQSLTGDGGNQRHRGSQSAAEERMTLEQSICEDLRAFETRLTDIITELQPSSKRWTLLLLCSLLFTLFGAFQWLTDPETYAVSTFDSFCNHKFFTANCILLVVLFFPLGIHRRICAPSIIRSRIQEVVAQFNMSCDDRGRLILMPHPAYYNNQNGGAGQ